MINIINNMNVILRNMAGNEINIEMDDGSQLMEIINTRIYEVIHPTYFNKFIEALKDLFNNELDAIDYETSAVTYNNNTYYYKDTLICREEKSIIDDIQILDFGEPYEGRVYNYVLVNNFKYSDDYDYSDFYNKANHIWPNVRIRSNGLLVGNTLIPYADMP